MECSLPPVRAGRAPQASRHSSRAEVILGAVGAGAVGADSGLVVTLASVAAVAARFGEGGLGPVADAETESVRGLLEQAPTVDAKPTLPASQSS
jgi:hypothetical protein